MSDTPLTDAIDERNDSPDNKYKAMVRHARELERRWRDAIGDIDHIRRTCDLHGYPASVARGGAWIWHEQVSPKL